MQTLLRELRYALRQLANSLGFSLTVVLILALGIGAATAIFSLVEGVLLRPLPFRDPGRLVTLGEHVGENPGIGVTARDIGVYADQTSAFSSVAGIKGVSYELSGGDTPETIDAARVNSSLFSTLGVQPILGRVFTAQEEETRQSLTVISYALWLDRFHRDPHILAKSIALDRKPYAIIGVMPRGFEFPVPTGQLHHTELWVPLSLTPQEVSIQNAGVWGYRMVARLKDGVTPQQGAQDADQAAQLVMRSFPPNMSAIHIRGDVMLLQEETVGEVRPVLRVLFIAVSIVLLLACVNVAGLLLLRAIRCRRVYAVRLALGAQSAVIVREALLEGLLLSFTGGLAGLALAAAAIPGCAFAPRIHAPDRRHFR